MLNRLTASTKLYLLVFVLCIFIVGTGVYGISEMRKMNQNTQTLYADRVIPMEQLTTVRYAYAVGILTAAQQAKTGKITFQQAKEQVLEAERNITVNWKAYMLTYLTADEKQLANQANALITQLNETVKKLGVILDKEDADALEAFINKDMYLFVNSAITKLTELIDLQVEVSEQIHKESTAAYNTSSKKFLLLIILSLAFAVPFSYYLVRNVKDLLKNLRESNAKITVSEEKYRSLFEHAGDAIFVINNELSVLDINTSAYKLLGYSKEEYAGRKIDHFFDQEELERIPLQTDLLKMNKALITERKLVKEDGTAAEAEFNIRALGDKGYLVIARDITERKKAEKQLKEFEHFFNNSNDFATIANIQGYTELLNPQFAKVLGYSEEELLKHQFYHFIHPDDIPSTLQEIERLKLSDVSINFVNRYRKKNGEYLWLEWTTSHDVVTGKLYAIARDITERKRIEDLLRESEERFSIAFRSAPAGISATRINDGKIFEVNEAMERFLGYSRNELIGKTTVDLDMWVDIEDRNYLVNELSTKGYVYGHDFGFRTKEGKAVIANYSAEIIELSGEECILSVLVDVTKQKQIQDALVESEKKYRTIFENVQDVFYQTNLAGIILDVSPSIKNHLGYTRDELIGTSAVNLFYDPAEREAGLKILGEKGEIKDYELHFKSNTGELVYISLNAVLIYDAYGHPSHQDGSFRNITERKKAEEKIKQSEARLKEAQAIALLGNWEIDMVNNIHIWSDEFYKIFGIARDEVESSTEALLSFMHPDDVDKAKEEIKEAFATFKDSNSSFRFLRKDETMRYAYIEWRFEFDKNKHPVRLYGILQDITERKKAEESIKQSEANYRQLFNLSPAPMWVLDDETQKFIQVNKACVNTYGYSNEEFANMTIADITPKDNETDIKNAAPGKKQATAFFPDRHHIKKSGEIMDVETSSIPVVLNGKKQTLVIAIDVTEKNRYEQKLTRAAIKAQEDERYEIGGELHDNVCQILATSQIYLGLIENSLPEKSRLFYNQTRQYITLASDEIRNLSHRLAPAFFDDATLEDAFKTLLKNFNIENKYQIKLYFDEYSKSHTLSRDLQLNLYRILQEQLRNILKYANAANIDIEVTLSNNMLQMKIVDNGVGFDTESIKEGIGLANMNRRAQLFSGTFSVHSSVGNGCRVLVKIPVSAEI